MKRLIALIFCASLLWTGCSKSPAPKGPEQFDRYIFFSQQVESKASLIESATAMGQFGVVGFAYPNTTGYDWETVKGDCTPNVFFNDQETENINVETLQCNSDGTATYAPLQGWHNSRQYAFFAYYPLNHNNVTLVNADGSTYSRGTPAILYSNAGNVKNSMVDVMVAPALLDKYWVSSSNNNVTYGELAFEFQHCLSSLGVNLKNSASKDIQVNSVKLAIKGILYEGVRISLKGPSVLNYTVVSQSNQQLTYDLTVSHAEKTISPNATGKELGDKLIFIPQGDQGEVEVTLTLGYRRAVDDGYGEWTNDYNLQLNPLQTKLNAGKKHIIYINFTETTVDVEVKKEGGAWVEVDDVHNTFN